MKLTIINEQNIQYFEGLIDKWWQSRSAKDAFIGLIDDTEAACSAAVFAVDEQEVTLRFIATDPKKRHKGMAKYLLTEAAKIFTISGAKICDCFLFFPKKELVAADEEKVGEVPQVEEEGDKLIVDFLSSCGFEFRSTPMVRSCYKVSDALCCDMRTPKHNYSIKTMQELTADEIADIFLIEERYSQSMSYVDAEAYTSPDNVYGRFLTDGEQIIAMVHCVKFGDSVLFDSICAPEDNMGYLPVLYRAVLESVKLDGIEEAYIDTYGSKLLDYQKRLLPCDPVKVLGSYVAVRYLKE